jgi:hypothetical protein
VAGRRVYMNCRCRGPRDRRWQTGSHVRAIADASLDQAIDEKLLVRADDDVAPDTQLSRKIPG